MKILLITDHHHPLGGAERHFFDLKKRLQQHHIEVLSVGFATLAENGCDYIVLKKSRSKLRKFLWQHLFHFGVYNRLRKIIKRYQPDVIHLHNVKESSFSVLKAIQPYPVVQTIHDYSVVCPTGWNLHQDLKPCETGMRRQCFWKHHTKFNYFTYVAVAFSHYRLKYQLQKSVNAFISPSPLLTHYLLLNRFKNVETIPPFISQSSQSLELMKPYHFLYVGQLAQHKGVNQLLDEFAIAASAQTNLQLTLVGEGPELNSLKVKIETLKLNENVHLVGWQNELSHFYAQCQAVIFPSMGLESFGLVITEAMCASRPVIATHRGHSPTLITDQVTGLLYDPLIPGELAKCILRLARQPAFSKKLGEAAYKEVKKISNNDAILHQILLCYEKVITK
jgi:glycosyltransferase involved in cell wall biosynthesis